MNVKPYPSANQSTSSNTSRTLLIIIAVLLLIGNCVLGYLYFSERGVNQSYQETQRKQVDQYFQKIGKQVDSLAVIVATADEKYNAVLDNYDRGVTKELHIRYNKPEAVSKLDTTLRKSRVAQLLDREEVAVEALAQLDSCERTMFQVSEIQHNTILTLQKGISDLGYNLADKPIILQPCPPQEKKPRFGFVHGVLITGAAVLGGVIQAQLAK